jgi:hypothetical protein
MGHLQIIESELRHLLAQGDAEAVIVWVKERVLESYRNGQAARQVKADGSSIGKIPARSAPPANLPR